MEALSKIFIALLHPEPSLTPQAFLGELVFLCGEGRNTSSLKMPAGEAIPDRAIQRRRRRFRKILDRCSILQIQRLSRSTGTADIHSCIHENHFFIKPWRYKSYPASLVV